LAEPNDPPAGNVRNQLEFIQPEAEANVFSLSLPHILPFFSIFLWRERSGIFAQGPRHIAKNENVDFLEVFRRVEQMSGVLQN
jgi:hypothetical protein